jgi:hypothetical protein
MRASSSLIMRSTMPRTPEFKATSHSVVPASRNFSSASASALAAAQGSPGQ